MNRRESTVFRNSPKLSKGVGAVSSVDGTEADFPKENLADGTLSPVDDFLRVAPRTAVASAEVFGGVPHRFGAARRKSIHDDRK